MNSKVLVFIDYYLPGYRGGGSVRSVANLVAALGDEFRFYIFARDHDLGIAAPYAEAHKGAWVTFGKADVAYRHVSFALPVQIFQILTKARPDVIYLSSFFSPWFTILPLIVTRLLRLIRRGWRPTVILGPRGEFSPAALRIKPWRKRLFIAASRFLGLHVGVRWHASTKREAEDISHIFGHVPNVIVAPDIGTDDAGGLDHAASGHIVSARPAKMSGALEIVFVSRIAEMKNLLGALRALRYVTGLVRFAIFGPVGDPVYWEQCRQVMQELPKNVTVHYAGELRPAEVKHTFANAHLFFLPTLGENFGHAILEALMAGCPVLLSANTPWSDVEAYRAGWVSTSLDDRDLASYLQRAIDMEEDEWLLMSRAALHFGQQRSGREQALSAHRMLLSGSWPCGDRAARDSGTVELP